MNGYELSRLWFDWCFDNASKIKPIHTALYFFCVEHNNRLGWKKEFGLPRNMAMDAIGVKNNRTFTAAFNDLEDWGFIEVLERSTNQHSANIISLRASVENTSAPTKALDKAMHKHAHKHDQKQSIGIAPINKPINQEQRTINLETDITQPDLFQIFWNLYGKKEEEVKCQREWFKIDNAEYPKIIEHVPKFVQASGDYLCKPFNYLDGRRWQDEQLPNYAPKKSEQDIPVYQRSYAERVKFAEENGIRAGSAQYNRLVNKVG